MCSQSSELCTVSPLNCAQSVSPLNCVQSILSDLHCFMVIHCRGAKIPVARSTIFCTVAPNLCTDSLWILPHVTLLVYRILSLFLRFWQICGPPNYTRKPGTAGFIILLFQQLVLSACSVTSTLAFVRGCCRLPLRHRCTLPPAMAVFSHAVPALLWPQLPSSWEMY